MLNKLLQGAVIVTALFLFAGCVASKKNHAARLLLQGIDTSGDATFQVPEPIIKKGDLLTIVVYSDNAEATEIFNQPQSAGPAGGGGAAGASNLAALGRGYQVDVEGYIYIHSLGKVKADGLKRQELITVIQNGLKTYLQNPYVTVRFTNARITIIGEVAKPGVIEIPDQKLSVLDAIGFAGDLTPFSRRDNILVVREKDGARITGRLDVRSPGVYESPFFYLQQNDLVYVEPNRRKPTGNEQVLLRNVAIVTSLVSVITLLVTLGTRL